MPNDHALTLGDQAALTPEDDFQNSEPKRFCPFAGMVSSSSSYTTEEVRSLRNRLRLAALLFLIGMTAWLVRGFAVEAPVAPSVLALHVLVTSICAAFFVALSGRRALAGCQLRTIELTMFALAAILLVQLEFSRGCVACSQSAAAFLANGAQQTAVYGFLVETCIRWATLIYIYGMFIPNHWRRAAIVTGLMAATPLVQTSMMSMNQPALREVLFDSAVFSSMMLWLVIPVIAAVLGSRHIGMLRQQVAAVKSLGAYRLKEKLGSGGMGDVYLAEHRLLKRPCAIKLIHGARALDPNVIARFETEVQTTARLTHPNTVEIYDFGYTDDGTFYYAMEYLPGLNLQDLVDRYGPMSPERAIYLLRQVCDALREAHSVGLIHRDIKPGNIFSAERGGLYDVAKLLDFGLVKSVLPQPKSVRLTHEGTVIGSPLYLAPEQALGETSADPRSDIYALGAVAYFLVTGQPMFSSEQPLKVLFAHVNESVVPPSRLVAGIPADLETVILRCLAKKPELRYQSAVDLESALANCRDASGWSTAKAAEWWSEIAEPGGIGYGAVHPASNTSLSTVDIQVQAAR